LCLKTTFALCTPAFDGQVKAGKKPEHIKMLSSEISARVLVSNQTISDFKVSLYAVKILF
jgi:hypothetical protein